MAAWHSIDDGWFDRDEAYGQHVRVEAFYPDVELADLCATIDAATADSNRLADELATLTNTIVDREDWPEHRPEAYDAPIPGRHWYSGCEPGGDFDPELGNYGGTGPRVNPTTGVCAGCGEHACGICGREDCPDHSNGAEGTLRGDRASVPTSAARPVRFEDAA